MRNQLKNSTNSSTFIFKKCANTTTAAEGGGGGIEKSNIALKYIFSNNY
jgi:hypothetical protein